MIVPCASALASSFVAAAVDDDDDNEEEGDGISDDLGDGGDGSENKGPFGSVTGAKGVGEVTMARARALSQATLLRSPASDGEDDKSTVF